MIFYLLTGLIVFLLLWIIFMPVSVRINTDLDKYEIVQRGTLRLLFDPVERRLIRISVFGLPIPVSRKSTAHKAKRKTPEKKKTSAKKKKRRPFSRWLYLVDGIFRSFRTRHLIVEVDLDDVVLTAKLTPLFLFLNRGVVQINTNLNNRYLLDTEIELRIYRILWVVLMFFIRK